jgi:hypothetical protein
VLEATIFETRKQPNGIGVTQSFDACIITTRVEMVVAPNIDVVKGGILIGFVAKLGSESGGVSIIKNLSPSSTLPTTIIGVVCTPQMVFTNSVMTIHVNRTANRPSMSSKAIGRNRRVDATNLGGGYRETSVVTTPILDHRNGHDVRPNKVAFKYLDFKKNVDPNVHVKVFNSAIKTNEETYEEYIINVFSYTLKNMTSD